MGKRLIKKGFLFQSGIIKDEVGYGERLRRLFKYDRQRSGFFNQKLFKLGIKVGCSISSSTIFMDDVFFAHAGKGVVIGEYLFKGKTLIHQNSTLGGAPTNGSPRTVGKAEGRLIVSAGAYVSQNITIGKNVVIGANAVVTKDVPSNCVVVGANKHILKSEKEINKYFDSHFFFQDNGK